MEQYLDLHFFGCGSAFNPAMGNTSAWFEADGCLFLVDCGETVYELLMKRSSLREYRQIYVLLTHLHADHVGSLGSLISYNYCILGRKISVIHPRATVVELLRLMGIKDEFYNYYKGLPEEVDCLRAEPVPVEHADNMDCFGYILETEKMRIYYSGDSARMPERIAGMLKEISEIPNSPCIRFDTGKIDFSSRMIASQILRTAIATPKYVAFFFAMIS